jgi:hypothetical protein
MTPFLEGVLASIVGGIILCLITFVLTRTFIPYLLFTLSHETDLSGNWYSHMVTPAGNPHDLTLELRQRFRRLKGTISVTKHISSTGQTEFKLFAVRGHVRDRFVTLAARNTDKRAIGVYVVLVEVLGDARLMKGRCLWYSVTNKTVEQSDCEWNRSDVGSRPRNHVHG